MHRPGAGSGWLARGGRRLGIGGTRGARDRPPFDQLAGIAAYFSVRHVLGHLGAPECLRNHLPRALGRGSRHVVDVDRRPADDEEAAWCSGRQRGADGEAQCPGTLSRPGSRHGSRAAGRARAAAAGGRRQRRRAREAHLRCARLCCQCSTANVQAERIVSASAVTVETDAERLESVNFARTSDMRGFDVSIASRSFLHVRISAAAQERG